MKNTKFSKAPWRIEYDHEFETKMIRSEDGKSLMCNAQYYPWTPRNDYDWILMSKSPKMYKMLDEILGLINSSRNEIELADSVDQLGGEIQGLLTEARGEKND